MVGGRASDTPRTRRKISDDLAATPLGRALWLAWALAVLWIACFDPFGLDSRVESMGESIVQRIFAESYPDAAARHIALVEITATDLENPSLELGFPLSSQVHAQLVRALTAAGVRAIFIDSEFRNPARPPRDSAEDLFAEPAAGTSPGSGHDALVDAIAAARRAGIPVITGPVGARTDLAALKAAAIETGVSWKADHPGDYPMHEEGGATAAATLYRIVCAGPKPLPGCAPTLMKRITQNRAAPMALRFGGAYPPEQRRFSGAEEAAACRNRSMLPALRRELWGAEPALPCTHHLVVPVTALMLAQNRFAELAAMLKGRVVMIGAGPGMGDDHVVPGVGSLPGVAIHAMALDNLLSWGDAYPRWPADFTPWVKIGPDELLKLFTLLVLPWLLSRIAARLCGAQASDQVIAWRTAAVALASSALLVLIAVLCTVAFAWPLSVAFAIVGMSTIVASLLSGPEFHRALQPFSDRRSAAVVLTALAIAALALLAPALLPVLLTLAALGFGAFHLFRRFAARSRAVADEEPEGAA